MLKIIGGLLMFVGFIAMSGSANDCDGACMEQANTMTEMLLVALAGLTSMAAGWFLIANSK